MATLISIQPPNGAPRLITTKLENAITYATYRNLLIIYQYDDGNNICPLMFLEVVGCDRQGFRTRGPDNHPLYSNYNLKQGGEIGNLCHLLDRFPTHGVVDFELQHDIFFALHRIGNPNLLGYGTVRVTRNCGAGGREDFELQILRDSSLR